MEEFEDVCLDENLQKCDTETIDDVVLVEDENLDFQKDSHKKNDYYGQFDNILCRKKTGVFVKVNSDGYVTNVSSDIFIDDFEGWIKIDEGEGDRFVHAQTQYYDSPLIDELGNFKFKFK